MEDWALRGMQRWPNVPALYGWLGLDRRGRWTIQGQTISRPQIIDTINANYAADEQGRWYFQNGPQRGYVTLESMPLLLRVDGDGDTLRTHTGLVVGSIESVWLDEQGSLLLRTEHGPALLADGDLDWALSRLRCDGSAVDAVALDEALRQPSGQRTRLELSLPARSHAITRIDDAQVPSAFGFVRLPQP